MEDSLNTLAEAAYREWQSSPSEQRRQRLRDALLAAGLEPQGHGVIAKAREVFGAARSPSPSKQEG